MKKIIEGYRELRTFYKTLLWIFLFAVIFLFTSLVGSGSSQVVMVNQAPPTEETQSQIILANSAVQTASSTISVVKVVDGDTIDVDLDGKVERLRLIGINTPETVDPRKPVECFGKEASQRAGVLLLNKVVTLEADSTQGERDKYGRLLRYVFLEDGTHFNKAMIQQGYAYEYTYSLPYKYQTEFKKAQQEAQASKVGLWATGACESKIITPTSVVPVTQPIKTPVSSGGAVVKKSSSNICHDSSSSYYERTKNYTPYPTIEACLESGGRLPAR